MSVVETARDGTKRPPRARQRGAAAEAATGGVILALFIISLVLPVFLDVGPLRLSPYRILLLILFVPMAFKVFSGRAGGVYAIDVCFMLFGSWMMISMLVNHGTQQLAFAGISVVELVGGYLFGRCFVRSSVDYRLFFRYFLFCLIFMLPFVILEEITTHPLLNQLLSGVFQVHNDYHGEQRLGLNRVQGFFEHPILYGLFCSVGIANFYYLARDNFLKRFLLAGFAIFMTAMSVSTAPLMAIVLQTGMIGWDWVTKSKWKLLAALFGLAYVSIDLLSNRSPFHVLVTYATLNTGSAYNRILIWRFGTENVAAHPVFGLGMNEWVRPFWMVASVDNFWLLTTMRYGLPAIVFLVLGILLNLRHVVRRQGLSEDERNCRTGYMVALVGLVVVLGTVHVWAATSVMVAFYFGAGVWLSEAGKAPKKKPQGAEAESGARTDRRPPLPRAEAGPRARPGAAEAAAVETGARAARPASRRNTGRRSVRGPSGGAKGDP